MCVFVVARVVKKKINNVFLQLVHICRNVVSLFFCANNRALE